MWNLIEKSILFFRNIIKIRISSGKYLNYLILSGIIILTLIIYSGTFKNDFTTMWDDDKQVVNNEDIRDLSTDNIRKIFTNYYEGMYQPLATLSFALEYKFHNLNPKPYHTDNLILHLLNVILVFFFIYALTNKWNISAIVALFFGIHPMNVETVAWISARSNSMCTLFFLGGLITYIYYIKSQEYTVHRPQYLVYTYILFILSLFSKSAAVCFPLVLILIDYYMNSSKFKVQSIKYWVNKLLFFVAAIIFGIVSVYSRKSIGSIMDFTLSFTIFDRIFLVFYSTSFYIVKLFLPAGLCAWHFYPVKSGGLLPTEYYLSAAFLIVIMISVIFVKSRQLRKDIIFGILFYLATILLVLQIIPYQKEITSERYAYITYIGLIFAAGSICLKIAEEHKLKTYIFATVMIIAVLIFSNVAYERCKVWADNLSLFNDMVEKYPGSFEVYNNRGLVKNDLGDKQGALDDYNKAIEINENFADAFNNRGQLRGALGNKYGALDDYNKVILLKPNNAKAFNNRGIVEYNLDNKHGALKDFERAISLDPRYAYAFHNRGNVKYFLGDKEGACSDWRKADELGYNKSYLMINAYCK
jgi:protein O-mannosyl-transferase